MSIVPPADYHLPVADRELSLRTSQGTGLHVELYGPEGAPTVVLSHGWTCSTSFWAPIIHRLSADHRVIAYDQRGHGRSEPAATPAGYSTDALADDLTAVLAATTPAGTKAVLAGHSMGGMTLMAAAGRAEVQERTAAALLASTGADQLRAEARVIPAPWRAVRKIAHQPLLTSSLPFGPVTAASRALIRYGTMGPGTPAPQLEACARIVHACPRNVRAHWGRVLAALDLADGVRQLNVPTSVLVGTADRLTPPVHSRRLHAALPRPEKFIQLRGVGHMSPLERPDAVAAEIRRLVSAHLPAPTHTEPGSATS